MTNDEPPIVRAIAHAVVAGGCEAYARADPVAAPGLTKAAAFHRAVSRAFVADMLDDEACAPAPEKRPRRL